MEEEDSKICENCKREIPAVNFMVHTVHCARNIKMCPVCKEPVPNADLQEHHEKLHKLLPCKHCGESVCGTDLEDHIRDSCGHTIKSCRFCDLELPRRELPPHEGYCGVRTEQCPDCREWVMIKYRQLHLDSNHGFLRLDDDPVPQPKRALPKSTNIFKPTNITNSAPLASTSNGFRPPATKTTNLDQARPRTEIRYFNDGPGELPSVSRPQCLLNGVLPKAPLKRTNDQPQINTAVAAASKVNKELSSRGAVKKRPAPPPPDPKRDLALAQALKRQQDEDQRRREQTAYNLSVGLPPVLSAAAKLEKLRKMDALHSREMQEPDYKNILNGRVWMDVNVPTGNVLGSSNSQGETNLLLESNRRKRTQKQEGEPEEEDRRNDFKNLKPMTAQEFMNRFQEMQLRKEAKRDEDRSERGGDRFSEIKSSLRELRRGLNEVTAPYNSNNADPSNIYSSRGRPRSQRPQPPERQEEAAVDLPCEFCSTLVPAHQLVLHQTGCRPDLAQYRRSTSPGTPSPPTPAHDEPVIPCEFCTESLPLYLISEHQERCGRDANLLYPD